jgi:L-aminopeptidase/D-esterase-like protein
MPISNDTVALEPKTTIPGDALTIDIAGLHIGVAEYPEGPTGCTVFYFPKGASTAVDVRGGSAGTIGNFEWNHAICLAGGSLYGLEAATGAAAEILALRGYSKEFTQIALVSGAIIYDFHSRNNAIYPDKNLGRAALRAAVENGQPARFPIGRHGAGRSAGVGGAFDFLRGEPSGQGGAYRQFGVTKIAAFSVVNALGGIVNRQGQVVCGLINRATGQHQLPSEAIASHLANGDTSQTIHGNTTLTVVVTNQKLSHRTLTQFARQVHASMARAIQPFHTLFDGDVLYAVTTNEVENPQLSDVALGVLTSETVWDAVLTLAQD